ncbi:PH domain-containing protein [uncultured Thomasclavelia sp.]|uniref:PH domain-containing protein n=1 Tax=uncultured Thomasclavelia sp. TaxID=3025759 RepID=UPI0025CDB5C5|nr:PH domain-containing protein [uncultured Thomasclavelia sp.]
MKKVEFKRALNPAILYFEIFYIIYIVIQFIFGSIQSAIVVLIVGIAIVIYFNLFRPYKYTIERRTLVINRRLGKDKEINLLTCETICDPVPKMTKIITSPHALELYTGGKKRIVVTPKDRMKFVEEIVRINKRIHVQVKEYAATHHSYEKKRRRRMKEETKKVKSQEFNN